MPVCRLQRAESSLANNEKSGSMDHAHQDQPKGGQRSGRLRMRQRLDDGWPANSPKWLATVTNAGLMQLTTVGPLPVEDGGESCMYIITDAVVVTIRNQHFCTRPTGEKRRQQTSNFFLVVGGWVLAAVMQCKQTMS